MEAFHQVSRLGRHWYAFLAGGYRDGIGLREVITSHRHQTAEPSGWACYTSCLLPTPLTALLPGRPLCHDTQAASGSGDTQTPPQFGAVATTGRPFGAEPAKVGLQRVHPATEYIAILAAQHATYPFATAACSTGDVLDRQSCVGQILDRLVALLSPEVPVIPNALGAGE